MPQHTAVLNSPTGRVRLVPPAPEDDEIVSFVRTHPVTLEYLRFLPTKMSAEEVRIRREKRAEDPSIVDFHTYAVNADGSTTFAGVTGLFNIDLTHESCEVGILVSPEMHRGGYGTEALYNVLRYAFEDRKFHRATFETADDNIPMQSWLEKVLGAKLEAERRDAWKESEGNYRSVNSYSLLEWEWTGHAKARLEKSMFARVSA
jgi:RimJ/RimL family protein N-acetyltransferase